MLQSFTPTHDWDCDSEPLLFDEEFCQILLKDLQMLPTPPQSPPTKSGLVKPWSKVDQLEFVSELLLEELTWDRDAQDANAGGSQDQRPHVSEDCLWRCGAEKSTDEKLSSSPLLSDIDTTIFEEIAGSTLDCHDVALECRSLEGQDLFEDGGEQRESSSDFGSMSTWSESSTSDSDDEIDVVTVKRPGTVLLAQQAENRKRQRAMKRRHQEIQLQHNYAAPCPVSPRRPDVVAPQQKRARGESQRQPPAPSRARGTASRLPAEVEDEEERRRTHNVMERQRRNELKNCFLRLRDNVPELSHNDKASKVVILKKARDSIRCLEAESHRLSSRRDKLVQKQEQLKRKLEQLR